MTVSTASIHDCVHRFYFEEKDVRGEMASLQASFQQATTHQLQHPVAQRLLGEFFAAVSLLAGVLKFEGLLTLQVRGDGPVPLVMAEANHNRMIRGIVQFDSAEALDALACADLKDLVGDGVLTLILDPAQGQRYQGIIALDGPSLADCLSDYFVKSEQLATRFWLFSNGETAAGLMLQALPASGERQDKPEQAVEDWRTLVHLASTLTADEAFYLPHETLLFRLFHEYAVRLMPAVPVAFYCHCSRQRSGKAIVALGEEEARALFEEQPEVSLGCQFCGQEYVFSAADLQALFHPVDVVH